MQTDEWSPAGAVPWREAFLVWIVVPLSFGFLVGAVIPTAAERPVWGFALVSAMMAMGMIVAAARIIVPEVRDGC